MVGLWPLPPMQFGSGVGRGEVEKICLKEKESEEKKKTMKLCIFVNLVWSIIMFNESFLVRKLSIRFFRSSWVCGGGVPAVPSAVGESPNRSRGTHLANGFVWLLDIGWPPAGIGRQWGTAGDHLEVARHFCWSIGDQSVNRGRLQPRLVITVDHRVNIDACRRVAVADRPCLKLASCTKDAPTLTWGATWQQNWLYSRVYSLRSYSLPDLFFAGASICIDHTDEVDWDERGDCLKLLETGNVAIWILQCWDLRLLKKV